MIITADDKDRVPVDIKKWIEKEENAEINQERTQEAQQLKKSIPKVVVHSDSLFRDEKNGKVRRWAEQELMRRRLEMRKGEASQIEQVLMVLGSTDEELGTKKVAELVGARASSISTALIRLYDKLKSIHPPVLSKKLGKLDGASTNFWALTEVGRQLGSVEIFKLYQERIGQKPQVEPKHPDEVFVPSPPLFEPPQTPLQALQDMVKKEVSKVLGVEVSGRVDIVVTFKIG